MYWHTVADYLFTAVPTNLQTASVKQGKIEFQMSYHVGISNRFCLFLEANVSIFTSLDANLVRYLINTPHGFEDT